MELYPADLICNIAENDIDAVLREFYYKTIYIPGKGSLPFREVLGYSGREFSDFVGIILNKNLKGKLSKDELRAEFNLNDPPKMVQRSTELANLEKNKTHQGGHSQFGSSGGFFGI